MSTRPFLEDIEKKWLAFQLLCGIRDCHARDIFHGDIKTENTLVTSWNWLYLSDFSSSFKPTTLPEDNPADFSYFFDTAGRRTCYLAPERFVAAGEVLDSKAQITWAMDVFSAGCVVAELFLETPIFTLSQLYKYRTGEYDPFTTHVNRIVDKDVREMVTNMISLEPESRYSAEEYLNFWRKKVFPDYFYSFLHQYMGLITDPSSGRTPVSGANANLGEADDRIDRVYYDFDKISYFLGYENEKNASTKASPSGTGLELFPVHLNIPNNEHQASIVGRKPADDGTLIFLALVVSSLRNTARATAKIRACDILLAFSERLTDEAKLDRVLPYLVSLLSDNADIVKVAAIRTVTQLMALVTVVSPVNAHVFPEYILPRMGEFLPGSAKKPSALLRATYSACLGSLATSASRFVDMVATLRADGSLPTVDPETEDGINTDAAFQGLYDNARGELIEVFGRHTKALITDSDTFVKRAFLGSVPELCMFFGTADSNDIILSHLNTYLNDRNWMLKCAFFKTIVGIATFLGGTSLEEFILPLMVQALTDPEEHVVQSVIHSFASMAELGLFQRSKIWELVDVVGRFTMHPNIWIREAAAMFLSSSSLFLSSADNQCIVLPLIKPYLKSSINDLTELVLLDNLKKPISRAVLEVSITWATKVDRGIFWKPVNQLRALSMDPNSLVPNISAKDLRHNALQKVPKNEEDEQWLSKLRNMGLSAEDDIKLLALREYIWRLAPLKARQTDQQPAYLGNVIHLRSINITPQTVMFDDQQVMDEPLRRIKSGSDSGDRPHTIADALLDASMTIDDSIAKRRKSAYNTHKARLNSNATALAITPNGGDTRSPISPSPLASSPRDTGSPVTDIEPRRNLSVRPANGKFGDDEADTNSSVDSREMIHGIRHKPSAINLLGRKESSKTAAETGMTSTNAFGKVEGPFSQTVAHHSALAMAKEKENDDQDQFRFRGAHSYSGNDPNILKMLDAMYMENYPSDTAEFGPMVAPSSRRKAISKNNSQDADKPWRPEGNLVATFSEHLGAAKHIAVASDQLFFITGGDDGNVKIWDTGRLERNIAHRSRQTHTMSAAITALCFVEHTHSFISCSSDGNINVVRVDCSQSGTGTVRYAKLKMVREHSLPNDEFAVWADHFKMADANPSVLIIATNRSRILAIDLRTLKTLYVLNVPVHHGTPICFFLEKKRTWMLLGTSHGVVNLFDLRFKLLVKSFGVGSMISRISMHPKGRNRWVTIASGMDVLVIDIEKTPPQIREVYHQGGSSREGSKGYEIWPVDDRPESMLGRRFATALESNAEQGVQAMITGTDLHDEGKDAKYGFLITGCGKKITYWALGGHIEDSLTVSGLSAEETKPTFVSTHPTPLLTLNVEKLARTNPSAPNAAAGASKSLNQRLQSKQSSRSTVISLGQQVLLRNHLDTIQNLALIEVPYGMIISLDRSGVICVFA